MKSFEEAFHEANKFNRTVINNRTWLGKCQLLMNAVNGVLKMHNAENPGAEAKIRIDFGGFRVELDGEKGTFVQDF